MSDEHRSDVQAIVDVAQEAAAAERLTEDGSLLGVVLPAGGKLEKVDLEPYGEAPRRARGTVKPATVDAFTGYVDRHKSDDDTTVWVDVDARQVVGVIDDHGEQPGFGEHRAELRLRSTPGWEHWLSRDGKLGSQLEFAEHVEDGSPDIAEPPAAEMLEVAQSIQGTRRVTFASARRLDDGSIGIQYDEEHQAAAGQRGELEIPSQFTLLLAPFLGENAQQVVARLRWRLQEGGQLLIGYKLERPEELLLNAATAIAERLAEKYGEVCFVGAPR